LEGNRVQKEDVVKIISHRPNISEDILAVAIEALSIVELEDISLRDALHRAAAQLQVGQEASTREASRLAFETLNMRDLLDAVLERAVAPAELEDFTLGIQALLRIFLYTTRISPRPAQPASLAEIGRRILGWNDIAPIERTLGRLAAISLEELVQGRRDNDATALTSHNPVWFTKYATRALGRTRALKVLFAPRTSNRTIVRLNPTGLPEADILKELESRRITLEHVPGVHHVYSVITAKEGLRKEIGSGLLRLQDLPSSIAVAASSPMPGKSVLFASPLPSSAVTYMAQFMTGLGSIRVIGNSQEQLSRVADEASRSKASPIVETIVTEESDAVSGCQVDTVMLHAPNSRTGLFWREPSLKWRTQPDAIEYFTGIQDRLLDIFSKAVRPGGNIAYWTRSITIEEDELMIQRFQARHPEFIPSDSLPKIGFPGLRGLTQAQRLFPDPHGCDGAFIALLTKMDGP
jgi:16S rRNA C967 or C1407 C5-methylase (RsmB/RsmF family)